MIKIILTQLYIIQKGGLTAGAVYSKIKATFILSIFLAPVINIFERLTSWYITNHLYVELVMGAIVVDHLIGTLYHYSYKKDFCWKQNVIGLLTKVSLVVGMAYLFEALNQLMNSSFLKDYSLSILRITVFMYPAMSAIGNATTITGGKFPPKWIVDKIKNITKTEDNV